MSSHVIWYSLNESKISVFWLKFVMLTWHEMIDCFIVVLSRKISFYSLFPLTPPVLLWKNIGNLTERYTCVVFLLQERKNKKACWSAGCWFGVVVYRIAEDCSSFYNRSGWKNWTRKFCIHSFPVGAKHEFDMHHIFPWKVRNARSNRSSKGVLSGPNPLQKSTVRYPLSPPIIVYSSFSPSMTWPDLIKLS